MSRFATEQEEFWAGEFGTIYSERNMGDKLVAANIQFFSKILEHTNEVKSVIEFGANIGLNLKAIRALLPSARLTAVEINSFAVQELEKWGRESVTVYPISILDFEPANVFDLALVKGVLIHINPEKLPEVYDILYRSSLRYICIAEYYNPSPVSIKYREHEDRLFKRDFCGEIMDRFADLRLLSYGFAYHRDLNFPQDDITWFLLEKNQT
jgi:spore coat polysaccharide biosynthesis protein SpsF